VSEPFLGEIRMFGFNFAPVGWALAAGQLLPISQNTALFSLLGTQFGGDGVRTFALPDLRGRVAIQAGQGTGLTNHVVGDDGGAETVTLTSAQMPNHTHQLDASSQRATTKHPAGAALADAKTAIYAPGPDGTAMNGAAIGPAGSSQPVEVLPPFLTVNFCIALQGIFPARP
jgi:microcystin-dependent protein